MAKKNIFSKLAFWRKEKAHISFQSFFGGIVPPEATTSERLNSYRDWAYACINAISEEVGSLEYRLFKLTNGNLVEQDTSPLLDLLYKVNPFQTKKEFLQLHQIYKETAGESFWFLERGKDNPKPTDPVKEIWLLRPDLVEVIPDDKTFIKGYIYMVGGRKVPFLPHEIIHFKYPNPINPYRGYSPMQAGALSVDTHNFASQWNRNFFYNSARPDGALMTDGELHDDQRKRLMGEWEARHGSLKNSQRVAILEGGLKYENIGASLKDMDFNNLKDKTRDEILSIWRVPKVRLGMTDDVNRAAAEASDYVFSSRVIKPKMQDIVDTLNEFLVPIYGDDLILDFDDPTPENREATVKEYEAGHNRWLTTNEIRGLEGLEEVDGGNVIYQSIALFPIGSEAEAEEAKRMMVKLEGKKFVDVRKVKRLADLKAKLLASRPRRKVIEELRRRIELQMGQNLKAKDDGEQKKQADREAELLNDVAKANSERDFYKAQSEKNAGALDNETKRADEAERLAKEALDLDENGKRKADTTQKGA